MTLFKSFATVSILLAAPLPALAYSDCYRDCMQTAGCWDNRSDENVSYCSGVQARCSSDCRDQARGGGGSYGSIAYSVKDDAYGYSHGWTNRKKAGLVAMKNCKQNGKGCEEMVWFSGSCGAVVSDGKRAFWGQAGSPREAMAQAMKKCSQSWFHGKCAEKVSHCSE